MTQKTAVEWLVNEMVERNFFAKDTPLSYTTLEHLTNQAKAMEKEQIDNAWDRGYNQGYYDPEFEKENIED